MSKAIPSNSCKMIFRAFISSRPRSRNDREAHSRCASRERATARATSSGIIKGARPISSPVAGSREMSLVVSDLAGMLWAIVEDYGAESCDLSVPPALAGGSISQAFADCLTDPPTYAGGTDFVLSATIRLPIRYYRGDQNA